MPGSLLSVFDVTSANLISTLKGLKGGETVRLHGSFLKPRLENFTFFVPITMDLSDAEIVAGLFNNLTGFHFSHGVIIPVGNETPKGLTYSYSLQLNKCKDISFYDLKARGPEQTPDGYGIQVNGGSDIRIAHSSFAFLKNSVLLGVGVDGASVTASDFYGNAADGIDIAASYNILIEANNFHDFKVASGEHPDAVQIWNRPWTPRPRNITIRGNTIRGPIQGISNFSHEYLIKAGQTAWTGEVVTEDKMMSDGGSLNLTIESNHLSISAPDGIVVTKCEGLTLNNNSVVTEAVAKYQAIIHINTPQVTYKSSPRNNTVAAGGNPLKPAFKIGT